jgi:pimeloyl-ACP methyl ester carboxylesterase
MFKGGAALRTAIARRIGRRLSVAALALSVAGVAAGAWAEPSAPPIRQGFVDSVYGQLHYLTAQPAGPAAHWKTPLVLFHMSPMSAREFGPLISEMGRDRVVIAFDTPGQGLSDGPDHPVTIADYAVAIDKALHAMGYGPQKPIDEFADHTGVWIAGEIAISDPAMVQKIAFNGVYVVPEAQWREHLDHIKIPPSNAAFFDGLGEQIAKSHKLYMDRGVSDADWGRIVVDSIAPMDRLEFAKIAAFSYTAKAPARLKLIRQPVTLLLMDDTTADATRAAAALFPSPPKVVEHMEWRLGFFYTKTAEVAAFLRQALD